MAGAGLGTLAAAIKYWVFWGLLFIKRTLMLHGFLGLMTSHVSYDLAALLIRLAVGLAWLPFGLKKLLYPDDFAGFPAVWPFSSRTAFRAVRIIELIVPLCLIFGFCTRLAAIPGIVCMAVATKVDKGPCFTSAALIFCLCLFAIFFIGSGSYSLDYLLQAALSRHAL